MTFLQIPPLFFKAKYICYFLWKMIFQFTQAEKYNFSSRFWCFLVSSKWLALFGFCPTSTHKPFASKNRNWSNWSTIFAHNRHLINVLRINDSSTPHETWFDKSFSFLIQEVETSPNIYSGIFFKKKKSKYCQHLGLVIEIKILKSDPGGLWDICLLFWRTTFIEKQWSNKL